MVLPFYIFSEVTSLLTVRIGTGVVVTVALQQIDRAPDTEASAESNNEGLKNTNSRIKESHKSTSENIFFDLDLGRYIHSTIAY